MRWWRWYVNEDGTSGGLRQCVKRSIAFSLFCVLSFLQVSCENNEKELEVKAFINAFNLVCETIHRSEYFYNSEDSNRTKFVTDFQFRGRTSNRSYFYYPTLFSEQESAPFYSYEYLEEIKEKINPQVLDHASFSEWVECSEFHLISFKDFITSESHHTFLYFTKPVYSRQFFEFDILLLSNSDLSLASILKINYSLNEERIKRIDFETQEFNQALPFCGNDEVCRDYIIARIKQHEKRMENIDESDEGLELSFD